MKKQYNYKAKFVVSIDFEMAWGGGNFFLEDKGNNREYSIKAKKTRQAIDSVIELFEKYKLSATWAFVGHLMLNDFINDNNKKYPDLIGPYYNRLDKNFFCCDSCLQEKGNSIWYADDVLKKVMSCKVEQEIASHSFNHILFGEESCSKELAESDIKKCIEVASVYNIKLSSFIFPNHSEGHKDILKKYGFKIYRSNNIGQYNRIKNKKIKRIALIIDKIFTLTPTTGKLKKDEYGLYYIPDNLCYFRYEGWKNKLTYKSSVKKAKKGIDLAIRKGEVFHFWFHPYEIASSLNNSINDLEEIFEYLYLKVKAGLIENVTMKHLVEDYESIMQNQNIYN